MWKKLFSSKRPFTLTRPGWVFILYTIGVGAGAINTGNNLLYIVFGLFLGIILASGILSDLSLWGLEASFEVPPHGQAGQTNFVPLTLMNTKKWIPSLSVRVELEGTLNGQPLVLKVFVPSSFPGETFRSHFSLKTPSRGLFQVTQLKFSTLFPFGLLMKWWVHQQGDVANMIVFPQGGLPIDSDEISRSFQRGVLVSIDQPGHGTMVDGIRNYHPSDNPRSIHWKASAKKSFEMTTSSNWLVKVMDSEESEAMSFVWPPLDSLAKQDSVQAEEFIRLTASFMEMAHNRSSAVALIFPESDAPGSSWRQIRSFLPVMEFLALVDLKNPLGPRTAGLIELLQNSKHELQPHEIF